MPEKANYNILVIEDNPGDFYLVEEFLLEQIKAPVILNAWNYEEAKQILTRRNEPFDIILLDLSLPDKTGEPLIAEIVKRCANAPVIVLTGYSDLAFGAKSLSLGISDYILKDELTALSLYKSIIYSTERKRIMSELILSEKNYGELFHLSPLPMFVFDLKTLYFLDVNEAFTRHYGYSRTEILEMTLREIRPADEISAFEEALFAGNRKLQKGSLGIFRHLKKNGEIIQVDIQSNFIKYKGRQAKVTIASDMTERLNYIKAIEEQNKKLSEISWMQSHVIRAPLARIMGLIDLFQNTKDHHEREKMLEYLSLSAKELDSVIKDITNKTKISEDK